MRTLKRMGKVKIKKQKIINNKKLTGLGLTLKKREYGVLRKRPAEVFETTKAVGFWENEFLKNYI